MKTILTFLIFLLSFQFSIGQQDRKGTRIISLSAGTTLSNLLSSEAPHKINIYGSDIHPAQVSQPVSASPAYFDYSSHILKDLKTGLVVKAGMEYFLKDDWSVVASVAFDEKGVDLNFKDTESREVTSSYEGGNNIGAGPPPFYVVFYDQHYHVKLSNRYLTAPVLIRKYFFNEKFYVSGGGYVGWLNKSEIYTFQRKHRHSPDYPGYSSDYYSGIDHKIDDKKEFTNRIDYGLAIGGGLTYPLTNHIRLHADLLLSAGLRKIDAKYNNEYEERHYPGYSGVELRLRSTNYFGLNSNATNISSSFTFGIGYKLG